MSSSSSSTSSSSALPPSRFRASTTRLAARAEVFDEGDLSSAPSLRTQPRTKAGAQGGEWQRVDEGVDIFFPEASAPPKGLVHFVGGAVVGAFPRAAYGPLLERLGRQVNGNGGWERGIESLRAL
jgi:hypothetical protein